MTNSHRVVQASAADIERWQRDPLCPMYNPVVAASAPAPAAPEPLSPAEMDAALLGRRWWQPGMRRPASGDFDIPAVAGSASDVQNAHQGCAAQQGDWNK